MIPRHHPHISSYLITYHLSTITNLTLTSRRGDGAFVNSPYVNLQYVLT